MRIRKSTGCEVCLNGAYPNCPCCNEPQEFPDTEQEMDQLAAIIESSNDDVHPDDVSELAYNYADRHATCDDDVDALVEHFTNEANDLLNLISVGKP